MGYTSKGKIKIKINKNRSNTPSTNKDAINSFVLVV
jgi:hypothetical protein